MDSWCSQYYNALIFRWGCQHENEAKNAYSSYQHQTHSNFKISESGLHIHPAEPHLGATPDGLIECSCCPGKGVLEIKCPFCHKDKSANEAAEDKTFCLQTSNDMLSLKTNHAYYYQIQIQMYVTERTYCDFVVWTNHSIHIERITLNLDFVRTVLGKVRIFFVKCILPELAGHYFSRKQCDVGSNDVLYCYCRKSLAGAEEMIACASETCTFKRFHLACIGLKRRPKAGWQCIECKKISKKSNNWTAYSVFKVIKAKFKHLWHDYYVTFYLMRNSFSGVNRKWLLSNTNHIGKIHFLLISEYEFFIK